MPVQVVCPNPECGASLSISNDPAGRSVACPACGTTLREVGEPPDQGHDGSPVRDETELQGPLPPAGLPPRIGRYRVLRQLGRGGMGTVYLAHDDQLDRPVALKIPHFRPGTGPEILERFRREARAAASFHHPNFCPIYEVGQVGSTHYLAMAFIEGQALTSRVNRAHPMPPREAAAIVRQLAQALAEAHRRGILHRDLKPANVMSDRRGTLIIMDFGLARRLGSGDAELTETGVPMGTPHYMSPEQVRGTRSEIGPATDVYALGVILYELSTGRRPFSGTSTAVIGAVLHVEPSPPSSIRPGFDPELEAICLKAMAKPIEARYASMEDLAGALGAYLDRPDSPGRRRLARPAAGALLLGLLGLAGYVATDRGTLRLQGLVPGMVVRVDGQELRIEKEGEPIPLRAGQHLLLVLRGEKPVRPPESFKVRRGEETLIALGPAVPGPSATPAPSVGAEESATAPAEAAEREVARMRRRELLASSMERGASRLAGRDYEGAEADFNEAIRLDPDSAEAHANRGRARVGRGDLEPAFADFKEAIRLDPRSALAHAGRGHAWQARGDLDNALVALAEAIRLDPGLALAYAHRGAVWLGKKHLTWALIDLNEAIRLDPGSALALGNRGRLWQAKGDLDRALVDLGEAIRLDPRSAVVHQARGTVWQEKGDLARAMIDYKEAIRLDPKDPGPLNALAWIHATCPDASSRDGKKAVELATRACVLSAWKKGDYLDTLAAALAEAGDFEAAARRQGEAIALARDDLKPAYRARLQGYREKKPMRAASTTARPPSNP